MTATIVERVSAKMFFTTPISSARCIPKDPKQGCAQEFKFEHFWRAHILCPSHGQKSSLSLPWPQAHRSSLPPLWVRARGALRRCLPLLAYAPASYCNVCNFEHMKVFLFTSVELRMFLKLHMWLITMLDHYLCFLKQSHSSRCQCSCLPDDQIHSKKQKPRD